MDDRRVRLEHVRQDPRVALTVLDESWYQHVSLRGRVVEFKADTDFADIDRLSTALWRQPVPRLTSTRARAPGSRSIIGMAGMSELQSEVAMTQFGLSLLLLLPR